MGLIDAQVLRALGPRVLEAVGGVEGGQLPRRACLSWLIVHPIELDLIPLLAQQHWPVSTCAVTLASFK